MGMKKKAAPSVGDPRKSNRVVTIGCNFYRFKLVEFIQNALMQMECTNVMTGFFLYHDGSRVGAVPWTCFLGYFNGLLYSMIPQTSSEISENLVSVSGNQVDLQRQVASMIKVGQIHGGDGGLFSVFGLDKKKNSKNEKKKTEALLCEINNSMVQSGFKDGLSTFSREGKWPFRNYNKRDIRYVASDGNGFKKIAIKRCDQEPVWEVDLFGGCPILTICMDEDVTNRISYSYLCYVDEHAICLDNDDKHKYWRDAQNVMSSLWGSCLRLKIILDTPSKPFKGQSNKKQLGELFELMDEKSDYVLQQMIGPVSDDLIKELNVSRVREK